MSKEEINRLQGIIYDTLSPIIDSDYIFIDLPYYTNIGDALIWRGTEDFLASLPHRCLYRSSCDTFTYQKISKDNIILMQGGGNFGDLYPRHQTFRRNIIEQYPDNRIIILPQTVYYEGCRAIRHDASVMRKHNNLIICVRDDYSYRFLKKYKFAKNVLLVPDMAFCINQDFLKNSSIHEMDKTLFIKRIDKEFNKSGKKKIKVEDYDIHDWLTIEKDDQITSSFNCQAYERPLPVADIDNMALNVFLPHLLQVGIEQISQYKNVISTRLHGGILAIILGKKCILMDNSYGKNRQFYYTWLKDFPDVSFCKSKIRHSGFRQIKLLVTHFLTAYDTISIHNSTSL